MLLFSVGSRCCDLLHEGGECKLCGRRIASKGGVSNCQSPQYHRLCSRSFDCYNLNCLVYFCPVKGALAVHNKAFICSRWLYTAAAWFISLLCYSFKNTTASYYIKVKKAFNLQQWTCKQK